MSDFYLNLATMRKSRGWSQQVLADKLGVSRSAVAMWEKGERQPDYDTLEMIADVFNVPMSALLDDSEKDDELWDLRETLRRRPEMQTLFSLTKNASAADVRQAIKIIEALRGDDGDDTGA